ncbi:hypothetical protein QNI19_16370 [Cytophagaceae bacterium DM2B3-1]|uniref:Uncharacterized protein n=1 Tax=Xanthocytophaga flava TaxID=3048013 RepID=A0ABT7CLB5_9BACT|nr:hypothetical protein [Xanthocytophaga flavus]MDJ1494521.1 hypothetical protein [Xanthocytophaga flavus]
MKKFIEGIPLITASLLYLGYCYLHYYYKEFGINIYNYITNGEILLTFLPVIIVATSIIYGGLLSHFGSLLGDYLHEQKKKVNNEEVKSAQNISPTIVETQETIEDPSKNSAPKITFWKIISFPFELIWSILKFIYYLVSLPVVGVGVFQLIMAVIINQVLVYNDMKEYEGRFYYVVIDAISLYWIIYSVFQYPKFVVRNTMFISFFVVLFIGSKMIAGYRLKEAQSIIDGKHQLMLSFIYKGKRLSTNDTLLYVGQTEKYIFFYNKKTITTDILKIDSIESVQIKDHGKIKLIAKPKPIIKSK